ncbi:MAG: hypothetical protein EOO37_03625 [Cytophagaceae bacterium]|nr:MAG: hypothetical protein EOO37_03625 [Cytophagaceae bacterium]
MVGIDFMEAYFNTKNPVYLRRAEGVFAFIVSGWNDDLGGGVPCVTKSPPVPTAWPRWWR